MTGAAVPPGVPQLLKTGEVAHLIGVRERRVRYMMTIEELPHFWIGGQRRVRAVDLIEWAEHHGLTLDWTGVIH